MTSLLVGFDSAWSSTNSGAIVGILHCDNGNFQELALPHSVNFSQAEVSIRTWQQQHEPSTTIVMLDQPTIVKNTTGQRPVENIAGSAVGKRYGGMQPSNTKKEDMFGTNAPVWGFLKTFGRPPNPFGPIKKTCVFETYPVLTMIALDWILQDERPTGRLPKYNPLRRKTFSLEDWQYVCRQLMKEFGKRNLSKLARWLTEAAQLENPNKADQDAVDSLICLLAAIHLIEQRKCLMIGNLETGYIVVPYGENLHIELNDRCSVTGREQIKWVRSFFPNTQALLGYACMGARTSKAKTRSQ